MSREAMEGRRQRAREAAYDDVTRNGGNINTAILEAIETATRVKITDEVIDGLADVSYAGGFVTRRALVVAALAELGFEVED